MFKNLFPVTKYLIIINAVIFVFQFMFPELNNYIALQPHGSENHSYLQYFTAVFAHGGFIHIFLNMYVLSMFGNMVEKRFGSNKFIWLYLTTGILANIVWHLFDDPQLPGLGASGAIYGLVAIFTILNPDAKLSIIFLPFWSFKAKYLFGIFLLVETILAIVGVQTGIAHTVHVSGAVISTLYYIMFLKNQNSVSKRAGMGLNSRRKKSWFSKMFSNPHKQR